MSEMHFYGDSADERMLVQWLLVNGAELVPDLHYKDDAYAICKDLDSFRNYRAETRHFFVMHQSFSTESLEVTCNTDEKPSWYFIMPRNGGPALGLLLSGEFIQDNIEHIRSGSVISYPNYWSLKEHTNMPAPREERAFYRSLSLWMREHFTNMKTRSKVYWVGPGAQLRVAQGAKLVGIEDLYLRKIVG